MRKQATAPQHLSTRVLCAAILLSLALSGRAQVNVLTDNYDAARTNANLRETTLNTLNVSVTQFGKLFSLPVQGFINAQPLYVQNVAIAGKGTHNVVYVATLHNDVYAFDADTQGESLWHVNLGPSVTGAYGVDDLAEDGILSTPVIDLATNTMYVVANTQESGNYIYRLHALDITTGIEKFGGPGVIEATVPGTYGLDSQNGQIAFNPSQHLQRPGLLLLNNVVYIGFGSHGDMGAFHGWLFGYNAANVQQRLSVLNTAPDGFGASIWQGGRGPAADEQGNIYFMTGNGTYDGVTNFGESFVRLNTTLAIPTVADWFTPDDWAKLDDLDSDLGSCGPILTSSGLVIGGGKAGIFYVMDRRQMGHMQNGNGQILQSFQAVGFGIFNMAYWERSGSPIVYLRAYNDSVKAFRLINGKFETTAFSQSKFTAGLPYDGMAVSANGSAEHTAILWITTTPGADSNGAGTLHALAAADLTNELWNSDMNPSRDGLGNLAKYTAPTIANGKVYVPTFSNRLVVYGLTVQKNVIADVVNSASGLGGGVAPGELVVLYGSGLGPPELAASVINSSRKLSKNIAGTTVLFNGVAAPLLYVRADQVAAIVPNAVAGETKVTVQAQFQNDSTAAVSLPVTRTMPGLFTLDQSGHGQGAILNQDGTINGSDNPAPHGSIVVLFGTGQGLTTPDFPEDELASDPLPEPVDPVTVTIAGRQAEILYAGAAPGLAGVMQINVRLPRGIDPSNSVPVSVKIGANSSQPGVTLSLR
jgi:uncharacterized protein (TIGR03437 family)